jgi:outer membrane protein OmpA-like peptidoglycan-associated protein
MLKPTFPVVRKLAAGPIKPHRSRQIDWRPVACASAAAALLFFGSRFWAPAEATAVVSPVTQLESRSAQTPNTADLRVADTRQTVIDEQQATIRSLQARLAGSDRELTSLRPQVEGLTRQIKDLNEIVQRQASAITSARAAAAAAQEEAANAKAISAQVASTPTAVPRAPDPVVPRALETVTSARASLATIAPAGPSGSGSAAPVCDRSALQADGPMRLHFDRYQDTLEVVHHETLNQVVAIAQFCPRAVVEIKGFSDNRGTPKLKADISQRRAELTARYFEVHGVKPGQINVVAMADRAPVDTNETEAGRALNRRVEIRLRFEN